MRLSKFEIESIKQLAQHHFGQDVKVILFGSRANDEMRGGDIDLFIQSNNRNLNARSKMNFIVDLILKIGEQKIDVVLDNESLHTTEFFKTIFRTGKQLC